MRQLLILLVAVSVVSSATVGQAVELEGERASDDRAKLLHQTTSRGIAFLRRMQSEDGSYAAELGPGITALAVTALLRNGVSELDPAVARGLQYVEQFVQDDGGIYQDDSIYRNYETSLAMLCFKEAKQDRYRRYLERAQGFLKQIQWDEGEGHTRTSTSYGGAGYGKHKRPDLSNTAFFVEALKASGLSADDKAMQDALKFISTCQNLETHHNPLPFANKIGDGGFYYTAAAGGSSQAGMTDNGGLRSYGSMTYAGLKSMIYAGVDRHDPRVKAAIHWISTHYDLQRNPGMRQELDGLYYYYHTFAKSLDAVGVTMIKDAQGVEHDWKSELISVLAAKQKTDGSWVNDSGRWLEGNSQLVTAYALMSLSYCK